MATGDNNDDGDSAMGDGVTGYEDKTTMAPARRATKLTTMAMTATMAMGDDDDNDDGDGVTGDGATGYDDDVDGRQS
jgi:hypothetical protein